MIAASIEDWLGINDLFTRYSLALDDGDVEGVIAFFPNDRVVIGHLDFVYLNRGSLDGLEAGSPLEVVRGGEMVKEPVHGTKVEVPRRVVAQLLVVDAQPETAWSGRLCRFVSRREEYKDGSAARDNKNAGHS